MLQVLLGGCGDDDPTDDLTATVRKDDATAMFVSVSLEAHVSDVISPPNGSNHNYCQQRSPTKTS